MSVDTKYADFNSIAERLAETGKLKSLGGRPFLEKLMDGVATVVHAAYHCEQVKKYHTKREAIRIVNDGYNNLRRPNTEAVEQAAEVVRKLSDLTTQRSGQKTPQEIHAESNERWVIAKEKKCLGFPSYWFPLDNLLGSYLPPEQIVIGARPSCGKTMIVLEEAIHKAQMEIPVAIASLEMDERSLRERMAGAMSKVSTFSMRKGEYTEEDLNNINTAYDTIDKLPIYINDMRCSINEIEAWTTAMVAKHGIRMLFVDYLQLIRKPKKYTTMNEVVGEWTASIKELGKRLNICTVVASQFSRSGRKEESKTPPAPSLEFLRDSGEIEQHADIIILVYKRPGLDPSIFGTEADWPMEWYVAKHRNGPTGKINMMMCRKSQSYVSEHEYDMKDE